jgi:PPM family protein phosphatase
MKLKVRAGGLTDVGLKREHNEDFILVSPDHGLYAVADGMGGHAAGEVASRAAIKAIDEFVARVGGERDLEWPFGARLEYSHEQNVLHNAAMLANREVCAMAEQNRSLGGMGTTLAVLYIPDEIIHVCHVGDSRVYRYRNGMIEGLTQDHSWVNEQVQRNLISEEEARQHRWRNVITRALGNRETVEVDMRMVEPQPEDIFLLCSDGLTGMLEDDQIADTLAMYGHVPDEACAELVRLSNEAGGFDNISVVVVRIES